jgi:hypothetical protein
VAMPIPFKEEYFWSFCSICNGDFYQLWLEKGLFASHLIEKVSIPLII